MDLTLTDDQEMLASTAGDFLDARCPMSFVREMAADDRGHSPELWTEMAELGWTGLALDPGLGGTGAGFVELCLVIEQMGRHQLPSPFVPTVLCATALAHHGSDERRADLLPGIASGETIMTWVRAAPGAGWERTGAEVKASPEGDDFVLDGEAMFVPWAHVADRYLVVAETGGADKLSVFVVDADAEGFDIELLETVRADRQHRITFDGVRVAADRVVGDVGDGGDVVSTVESHGAVATCAEMVGGAQQVLDMTVAYATEREQFGTAIGSFQAIQHHCSNMGVDVLSSRLISYEAAWRLAQGLDAAEEVAMATAWVGEAYRRVCALGHQVHGAIGFTAEHDLHHFFRHAVASEVAFGDAAHHYEQVADLVGIPDF